MLLTNRWVNGEEAFRFGPVNQVVPKEKLLQTAKEMAQKIASLNPMAVKSTKQAVIRGLDLTLAEGLELERRLALGLSTEWRTE